MAIYAVESGKPIVGGRTIHPNSLLDSIAAAPEGTWIKGNTNRFEDVWTPYSIRAPYGGEGNTAARAKLTSIISAWSCFAWDHKNHRMILFGGGHANTSANDVYIWDGNTRQWLLGYYPTDYNDFANIYGNRGDFAPKGGVGELYNPCSCHCYDNHQYLEKLDRFLTFCGAAYNTGHPPKARDAAGNTLRTIGCFTLDLALAGKGYLGGRTGTNVHDGAWTNVDLPGSRAWYARDYHLDHAQKSVLAHEGRTNGGSATVIENGRDVVYQTLNSNGLRHLYRFEFVDHDYHNDIISKVGRYWNSAPTGPGAASYDHVAKKFVMTRGGTSGKFFGWDLMTPGTTNSEYFVGNSEFTLGPDVVEWQALNIALEPTTYGMDFDPVRLQYVLWSRGGKVWIVRPPETGDYFGPGWYVEKVGDDTMTPRPMTGAELSSESAGDVGILGKWRYAKDLDCFVGLQHTKNGDVWFWKPFNWVDPRS